MLHKLITFAGFFLIAGAFIFIIRYPSQSMMDALMKKRKKICEKEEKKKAENKNPY